MSKAHFGLVGLGVMGENLILNAERNGFSSVVYNRTREKTDAFMAGRGSGKDIQAAYTLPEFVQQLERPRRILMMIKAGAPIDATIDTLAPFLEKGDLVIDGGNSLYMDTERRVKALESRSFGYIGMGISGGAKGALEGPSMMPGGTREAYQAIASLVETMAAQVEDGPCVDYMGPGGAGHFVKTVHNGIEYGVEQILAEAYDLMKRGAGLNGHAMAEVIGAWNQLEELSSYLMEIMEVCLRTKDPDSGSHLVEKILDVAGQKGTGVWTVISALEMGVAVPTIYESVNARVLSSLKAERVKASTVLAGPPATSMALGSVEDAMAPLRDAVILGVITSYAQGLALLRRGSERHNYGLNLTGIAKIWKGGCIIRAKLLSRIQNAFRENPHLPNLMVDPWFIQQINARLDNLRTVVQLGAHGGIPLPCLSAALHYIDSYRSPRLPQNAVQAMRDCFGSHTYERVDREGSFHTEWLA
ncbi:MAG: 6-phosphogluconate dehydrogenase [Candidatus Synechococcus spongiarum 15L]|uniref:6-phosphogluconate dehydrogenase, decarboxylating n=2 Tax=Candidatus Synechococcus spongiarum TaxID=431041 RepID=A0A1T1D4P3_9SYNE|nr:NADP-dependent phosphogluconate dehydrogenase [Candidatus Synechococcus spongiarum]KKZ10330.1 MAG: 6-phosphogluconate dehydrogenase [Candidatus Synechococcus spongiarum 15L]MCY4360079.1 NADP-dependent phosphogluconate dehydrogenase [Cyanobacteria bacterium MAG APA_bin_95]OOV35770.1 phosphogluconate dehydrogenase (NADP(+)-dependent, decarboxylating) [Candidatus Synechococcus spongiarum LMB bulk15N]